MLTIELKKKHFTGSSWSSFNCPIYKALQERYPDSQSILVGDYFATVTYPVERRITRTKRKLQVPYEIGDYKNDIKKSRQIADKEQVIRKVVFI